MRPITLKELNMNSRRDVIIFLKHLWNEEPTQCPVCGNQLELLHKKAKKNNCDWQCKKCDTTFKTISLLIELNEQMPK